MTCALLTLPAKRIIDFIADAAERWSDPDFPPRVRITHELVARTGYSAPVVEYALDRLMTGLSREVLRATIESELGSLAALDTMIKRPGRPHMSARPRGTVMIISSRTTIGVALPAAVYALVTKNTVVVKDREDGLIRAFFETLAREHPAFAQAAIAQTWTGEETGLLPKSDVVVAFGSDETLQALRARLPARTEFVGFGSRMSCGYLTRETMGSTLPERVLEHIARDIVLYDGEGCMSLHVLFIEIDSPIDDRLSKFAEQLASCMEAATIEFPPGSHSLSAQLATTALRARHDFRTAIGKSSGTRAGAATVIIDRNAAPPLRPLTALIVPVYDNAEAAQYLAEYDLRVETLAVDHFVDDGIALAHLIGAHRITPFGAMQNPDLAGDHGGRARTLDFVELVDIEGDCFNEQISDCRAIIANKDTLEDIVTSIPGPRSVAAAACLQRFEAQGVTYLAEDFPVFWERAQGALVTDADGNRYIDCTAAFGVAAVGHTNPRVAAAVARQAEQLMHGMGDVHPSNIRASYLERLSGLMPGDLRRCFLGTNGADAIEFALKTAYLKTGRPRVLSFDGGYHGLSYGTLEVAGIDRFRLPFLAQLRAENIRLPYPAGTVSAETALARVEAVLASDPQIGAVLIEPIAGRAGTLVPHPGILRSLRELADQYRAVLIFDEIYTGFGRTGAWLACDDEGIVPDIICLGKAIGGGFPLSAAIGTEATFSAWPRSTGEAIHTSTYLGNPMACAAGHAVLDEFRTYDLVARARTIGLWLGDRLMELAQRLTAAMASTVEVRGRGMMWALDLGHAELAVRTATKALHQGLIVLPQGVRSTAVALTPPLVISRAQLTRALTLLENAVLQAHNERTSL